MFKRIEFEPEAAGPIVGVKILDLSRLVAGNMLTMALADLGAEVLKVEPPTGDTLRHWKVAGVSTAWKAYSRNKKSLCLDFHHAEARTILLDLAAQSHVLVESFRPGTMEKLGVAPETLLARNPRLIIARISGWGQSGPYRDRPGFGTLVEGISGFASMNGFADREPVLPPIYLGDMIAGLYGAMGVLAAIRHVELRGGSGQVIDIPLLDPLFAILGPQAANYRLTHRVKPRTGSRSTNSAPRNVYPTGDGKWVCLSASTQGMAERLFEAMGRPDLAQDDRFHDNTARLLNVEALDDIIRTFIAAMTQSECVAYFADRAVTVGPVYDMGDIGEDAHFHERDVLVELPDPEMGTVPVHTITPRFGLTPGNFHAAAPSLGEHTRESLRRAGYSDEKIAALESAGAVKAGKQE